MRKNQCSSAQIFPQNVMPISWVLSSPSTYPSPFHTKYPLDARSIQISRLRLRNPTPILIHTSLLPSQAQSRRRLFPRYIPVKGSGCQGKGRGQWLSDAARMGDDGDFGLETLKRGEGEGLDWYVQICIRCKKNGSCIAMGSYCTTTESEAFRPIAKSPCHARHHATPPFPVVTSCSSHCQTA